MKRHALVFFLPFVLFIGCETIEPPPRPVAYMFPTVRTIQSTASLQPRPYTRPQVAQRLHDTKLDIVLQQSGMLDMDMDVIVRGLRQHGFAEIDARRANAPFRWLTFSCLSSGELEIIACFKQKPSVFMPPTLWRVNTPSVEALNACKLSNTKVIRAWHADIPQKIDLLEQSAEQDHYWIMRWVFSSPVPKA